MKNVTKIWLALAAALVPIAKIPGVQDFIANTVSAVVSHHPFLSTTGAVLVFVGSLLHKPVATT
jgi:hypothetical protein